MNKFLILAALAGWFFAFQHDFYQKAVVKGVVGPFESKALCDQARFQTAAEIQEAGVAGKVGECFERTDA